MAPVDTFILNTVPSPFTPPLKPFPRDCRLHRLQVLHWARTRGVHTTIRNGRDAPVGTFTLYTVPWPYDAVQRRAPEIAGPVAHKPGLGLAPQLLSVVTVELSKSTRVVMAPVAMFTLNTVPLALGPPFDVVPQKFPAPSFTNPASGNPPRLLSGAAVYPSKSTRTVTTPVDTSTLYTVPKPFMPPRQSCPRDCQPHHSPTRLQDSPRGCCRSLYRYHQNQPRS